MVPQLYQALQSTSPVTSPRPRAGQPAFPDQYAIQRSSVGQQEWMYQQMREAAQSMRRGGIGLPSANHPNPSPDNPNRLGYVPAFFSHPTYDP
eukprot:6652204-Pyramimonas_sp.AAC.1